MFAKLMFTDLVHMPLLMQGARQEGRLNPIRKIVIMLQAMEKKIAEEGEKKDSFMRNSCTTARQTLVIGRKYFCSQHKDTSSRSKHRGLRRIEGAA